MEMNVDLDEFSTLSFDTMPQRIISSFIILLINAGELSDILGDQITDDFKNKIDASSGIGTVSGPALKLKMLLDIFMQSAMDVSLSIDKSVFDPGHEDYQFFSLFEDLETKIGPHEPTSITYLELMSHNQRAEVAKAAFDFSQCFPFIYRYQKEPKFVT